MQTTSIKKTGVRVSFLDDSGNILYNAPDNSTVGLSGAMYPESITIGEELVAPFSFVIPANTGITLQIDANPPTNYTGGASGLLAILTADFFTASAGGGGGGNATLDKQNEQLATMGAPSDSPTTSPFGSATQTALQKGIFGNGLKAKSLEQVVDKSTFAEYLRVVDYDPNTPPAEIKYLDPLTGLQVTAPTNPVRPVVTSPDLSGAIGDPNTASAIIDPNAPVASLLQLTRGLVELTQKLTRANIWKQLVNADDHTVKIEYVEPYEFDDEFRRSAIKRETHTAKIDGRIVVGIIEYEYSDNFASGDYRPIGKTKNIIQR